LFNHFNTIPNTITKTYTANVKSYTIYLNTFLSAAPDPVAIDVVATDAAGAGDSATT